MTITSHIMISIAGVALASILAWFVVGPTGATAEVRSRSGDTRASTVVVATISGQGTGKNKAHANDCRAHARQAIDEPPFSSRPYRVRQGPGRPSA